MLVRRGQSLAYSVYSLHRRADLYGDDAEDFRPERWDEDLGLYRDEVTKNWGYLPFNGGPRICLGSKILFVQALDSLLTGTSGFCDDGGSLRGRQNSSILSNYQIAC